MKKASVFISLMYLSAAVLAGLPAHDGYFTDVTGTLIGLDAEFETMCSELEAKTTCELAFLIVPDMGGLTVEDYAFQVFGEWGIGKKGKDNGVLFVLALAERKARIETGYGIEGILPDSVAGNLLLKYAVPFFKNDRWQEGVESLGKQLAAFIAANFIDEPVATTDSGYIESTPNIFSGFNEINFFYGIHFLLLLGLFVSNIIIAFRHVFFKPWLFLAELGVIGLLLATALIFFFSISFQEQLFISSIGAAVLYLIQFLMSRRHICPKCKKYMTIRSYVVERATYSSTGRKRITYRCTSCDYSRVRYEVIPRLTQSSSSSSSGWSSGSYHSSSRGGYSSGGGHSFGGGSSGGGGASVGF